MKKNLLIILLVIIVIGIYLNRSYAYIYSEISKGNLKSPDVNQTYIIKENMKPNKISTYVALGDSLTAGVGTDNHEQSYPYLLAQKLAGNNEIVLENLALPGLETSDINGQIIASAIAGNPDIITLLIGVNDIHNFISILDFKKNYEQILKDLTQKTNAKIYIINIPFLGANSLVLPPYNYYFDLQTKEFNEIIKQLANEHNVSYVDLYSQTVSQFKKSGSHYSKDLFHPSAEGYVSWAQIIYDNINQ